MSSGTIEPIIKRVKGKFPMPTQEERLDTVEFNLRQFKTETIKVYQDMAFEMTMVKGLTEDAIGRLATLSNTTQKHFERIDIRLNAMDAHLESMDKRLNQMETQLKQVDTRLDRVENMLTQILTRLSEKP